MEEWLVDWNVFVRLYVLHVKCWCDCITVKKEKYQSISTSILLLCFLYMHTMEKNKTIETSYWQPSTHDVHPRRAC